MTAPPLVPPTIGEDASAHRRPGPLDLSAGLLLVASVVLHVAAMLPAYYAHGTPLTATTDQAAEYALLAASWALALAVGLAGPHRTPVAAGLAVGLAATELGFRVYDLGLVWRYGTHVAGPGLWLMVAAWAAGAAGAVLAGLAARARHRALGPVAAPETAAERSERWAWSGLIWVLAAVTAGAFLPAWDRAVEYRPATGQKVALNLGDAFRGVPWQQMVGTVLVAVALLAVPAVAVRVHHRSAAAAAACGALLVLATQFVSAVLQVSEPLSPAVFGLSPAEAARLGVELSLRLTAWFTVDVLAAYALLAAVLVSATLRHAEGPAGPAQANSPPGPSSAPLSRSAAIPPGS